MTANMHWMIAAAGTDAQHTRQAGFSCVHFCSRLSEDGIFSLTALPASSRGDYLGIADSRGIPKHCDAFAREAISAAQNRHCAGVLADFERPLLQELTTCLDREAHQQQLTLFIPLTLADYAPHAQIIADTAISGGSLEEYFSDLLSRFGAERLAAQLTCSCMDFPLPVRLPPVPCCPRNNSKRCGSRPVPRSFFPANYAPNILPIRAMTKRISSYLMTPIRCKPKHSC